MTLMVVGLFKDSGTGSGDGETPSRSFNECGHDPCNRCDGPFFYLECEIYALGSSAIRTLPPLIPDLHLCIIPLSSRTWVNYSKRRLFDASSTRC